MKKIIDLDIKSICCKLQSKEITAVEITKAYLDNIALQKNIYVTIMAEQAMLNAKKVDMLRKQNSTLHMLAGVPYALTDNFCTQGIKTTCGSKMLNNFVPPYSATVYEKLDSLGAICLGKLDMDEFGIDNSKNTVEKAINTCQAAFVIGTDSCGELRTEKMQSNIVGIKPTYGRVSRNGIAAKTSSLEQAGVSAKTVWDAAIVLSAISGYDSKDSTSAARDDSNFISELSDELQWQKLEKFKIAIPKEIFNKDLPEKIYTEIINTAKKLEKMGAEIEEISMPALNYIAEAFYIISSAEISSNLARYDGIHYGQRLKEFENLDDLYIKGRTQAFEKGTKKQIMFGNYVLTSGCYDVYFKKAQMARQKFKEETDNIFNSYEIVMGCLPAYKRKQERTENDKFGIEPFAVAANMAGLPALSMPFKNEEIKGANLHLIAGAFKENQLFKMAYSLENQNIKEG